MLCAPSAPGPPGPAPASWEPGQGWPRTQTAGPSPPKSPRVPRKRLCYEAATSSACLGLALTGTFSVEERERRLSRIEHPTSRNFPKRTRGGKEPGQELVLGEEWAQLRGGGGPPDREQAGTQDGAAAGVHPHGPRRGAEEQHAKEESRRRVWAKGGFLKAC